MSWIRSIQGQLTEFANEVLSEATEEVADPESELQVAKKNCAEAERKYAIEASKVSSLENQVKELEEQVYSSNVEMDAISTKFGNMVQSRDDEIKKLKIQLEQVNEAGWNRVDSQDEELWQQEVSDLKKEVAHWKSMVDSGSKSTSNEKMVSMDEMERKLEEFRAKKENEITAIVEQHTETMMELREMYEERIQALQQLPASSSTSNTDMLDAVLLEKEELMEAKRRLEEMVRSKTSGPGSDSGERPVVVDLGSREELIDERIRAAELELDRVREEKQEQVDAALREVQNLKDQNQELTDAYNDLNEEFEAHRRETVTVQSRNHDLNERIDSLKANLIEYEERYEVCKRENRETVAQLERLSADFERLRTGIDDVKARKSCQGAMTEEVEKLTNALDESRAERERLRADVERFQEAVSDIDKELDSLRDCNRRLVAENTAMTENLARYETTMHDIISSSEKDIGAFRDQFKQLQASRESEREAESNRVVSLQEEIASLRKQNGLMSEESRLLKEVNAQMKDTVAKQTQRIELFEERSGLLENLRSEVDAQANALKDELKKTKEALERMKEKQRTEETKTDDVVEDGLTLTAPPTASLMYDEKTTFEEQVASLQSQLHEALMANNEKTEECETIRQDNRELEREVQMRQNCIDEMIAQTNTLQIQHQNAAQENHNLKQELLAQERNYLRLEEELVRERGHTDELVAVIRNLEGIILGDDGSETNVEESESLSSDQQSTSAEEAEGVETNVKRLNDLKNNSNRLKRYIRDLKSKNEMQAFELNELKSQMTQSNEEAEQTRSKLEKELKEAEEVDRGLLDGIEKRLVVIEGERAQKVKELEESQEREKQQKARADKLQAECGELKAKLEAVLTGGNTEKEDDSQDELLEKQRIEIGSLLQKLSLLENDVSVLSAEKEREVAQVVQLQNQISVAPVGGSEEETLRARVAVVEAENEELKTALLQKHNESLEYYRQLEACVARNQQLEAQFAELTRRLEEVETKLRGESDVADKRGRELERLKHHLLLVEETSTREAVEAEQRETELRRRVKDLEAIGHAVTEGATESTQQYQIQIASLSSRLESMERTANDWKAKCESEVKTRNQVQEALASLQGVVRELSSDHEKESASASHRNLELQTQIQNLNDQLAELRCDLEKQSLCRQSAEDDVERQKLQLEAKQRIIEELEVQVEELRAPAHIQNADSYRIDDATLRQLFLNYFTAEPSKKPDIALLLASILEYPPEDVDKVRRAVRQSGHSTSFFGSLTGGGGGSPAPTLTEQFIRFLEAESESARTAPHLPVRRNEPPPTISLTSRQSPSPAMSHSPANPPPPHNDSTPAALDSLLR